MSSSGASFIERLINVTFALGSGKFNEGGSTVKLEGLRVSAKITKAGGVMMSGCELQVFGMTLSLMNQLSTLGMQVILVPRNTVLVEAGDATNGMAVVFSGTITNAWADLDASPDACLHVSAKAGLGDAVQILPPTSYNGTVDVATAMAGIATQMGRSFENSGVDVKISNPYLYGSPRNQAYQLAKAARINILLDDSDKLAIWPKGGARGGVVPIVSPSTGMTGYPSFVANGIQVNTIYNPSIAYGCKIQVQDSIISRANGTWAVFLLDHTLESKMPGGKWESRMQAYNPNFPPPVLQ